MKAKNDKKVLPTHLKVISDEIKMNDLHGYDDSIFSNKNGSVKNFDNRWKNPPRRDKIVERNTTDKSPRKEKKGKDGMPPAVRSHLLTMLSIIMREICMQANNCFCIS